MTQSQVREVRRLVVRECAGGYSTNEDIVDTAWAVIRERVGEDSDLEAQVRREAERAIERCARKERSWPIPTDCDRLTRAFADLDARGVLARENYADCLSCGADGLNKEMMEAWTSRRFLGYVFFHAQDLDAVLDYGELNLAFGPNPVGHLELQDVLDNREDWLKLMMSDKEHRARARELGALVLDALQLQGLKVSWCGSEDKRITVYMKWQRRRMSGAASGKSVGRLLALVGGSAPATVP